MLPFANNPEIEALLAQYALPDEERKRLLLGNVLLGIGGGLMSGKRGNEIGAAGSGAVVGAQMGQQAVNDARANQFAGLKTRMGLQEYIDKEKARKQESDDQAEVGKIFSGGTQLQNMGPGGPTPQNAAAVAPMGQVEKYRKAAEMYAGRGKVEDAAKLNAIADKLEEEYSTSPQTVRGADGKLQLAQFGKRGGIKVADGMTPAEKLHFASTGGMAGVGMDPYSGAQVSQGLPVTMDPAQADASKRGWAQYQLSKAAADRAAKEGSSGGKPQMVNGQWVFPPDAQNPTGRAVTPEGMAPGAGKTPPQAFMDKSNGLKNLSNSIADYNKSLETLSTSTYFDPKAATELMSRYTSLKMDLKNLYELGALAGPDVQILEEGLTNPASLKGFVMPKGHFTTQTQVLKNRLESANKNLANSYGQPYVPDEAPTGNVTIKGEADFAALPSGAEFIGPDGKRRRKP